MASINDRGLLVEDDLVNALNNIRYKNLSPNMKKLIRDIFGSISPLEKIKCKKCEEFVKPDIAITVKKDTKYVSIKSGTSNVLHSEIITTLVPFLRNVGIKEQDLKILCYYLYGDGTLDGSGKVRRDYHETYNWLKNEIKMFNDSVNENLDNIIKIVYRIAFDGVNEQAAKADFIYCGDLDYGEAVSRLQITKYIKKKSFAFYENIHIGPLLIKPHAKYAHKEIKNYYNHNRLDFYWPNFKEDVHYIYNHFSNRF